MKNIIPEPGRVLSKEPKRVEIIGNEIAIFAHDVHQAIFHQTMYYSNNRALSRYKPHDQSLRFPKTVEIAETIWKVLAAGYLLDNYELSDDFKLLVNELQQVKRIDLLPDEHPDRCVAVYYPQSPSLTIDPEFHGFRDKVDKLGGVYETSDCSWRFPLTVIGLLAIEFSSPVYYHSERFLREFDPIDCGF